VTSLGITQDVGNLDLESLIVITTMFFRIIGVSLDNSNRSPVERLSISHSAIRIPQLMSRLRLLRPDASKLGQASMRFRSTEMISLSVVDPDFFQKLVDAL